MKVVKVILGTLFGLATIRGIVLFLQTLLRFIRVWATSGYSAQGLSETGAALTAVCILVAFTKWTFESAFREATPVKEELVNDDKDQDK